MTDEMLASAGSVSIRRLRNDEADMNLLLQWLTDQKVIAHVYGEGAPWTYEKVCRAFVGKTRPGGMTCGCIIESSGQPVGYVQFYPVKRDSYLCSDFALKQLRGAYGMDMFIGIPALWRKGLGSKALKAVESHLKKQNARLLCVDPAADSEPGLRFWPKAGFEPLEVIENYDDPSRQSILMIKEL